MSDSAAKMKLNTRLGSEKRWLEYKEVRDALIREGVDGKVAWMVAAAQFPPLDGSPLECELTGELANVPRTKVGDKPPVAPPAPKMKTKNGKDGAFTDFRNLKSQTIDRLEESKNAWAKLFKSVDTGKSCGSVQSVQWIYDNAATEPEELKVDKVPSRGALAHLRHVQANPQNYASFIDSVWNKTIPNKNQLDYESRFSDDGRKQFGLLDQFIESLEEGNDDVPTTAD